MSFLDWLTIGRRKRLQRAVKTVETLFDHSPLDGEALDGAARSYRRGLRLALRQDPSEAVRLLRTYDERILGDRYSLAFRADDETWLSTLVSEEDSNVLTVVFELAARLRLETLQRGTASQLGDLLGHAGDANRLVSHLERCRQLQVLETDGLTRSLRGHMARSSLEQDAQLWSSFFAHLPEPQLPPLFEVHCFLGRGAEAARLADTLLRQQTAVACCLQSARLGDVEAGLELARGLSDMEAVRRLEAHAGDLLFDREQYAEALTRYREAVRPDRVSACHERLGQFLEALAACPAEQPDRLAHLAQLCQPGIDGLVERREFVKAAREAEGVVSHLARAVEATEAVLGQRADAVSVRQAVLAAGRQYFRGLVEDTEPAERQAVHARWSQFEEEAGDFLQAARQAEDAVDRYRAARLYRQAERFGEASRVLEGEDTPEGLIARAEAREAGGDPAGAARLREEAGQLDAAAGLFQRAGEFAAAARCLLGWRGAEAIEDPRLAEWLRRAGKAEELARHCLEAIEREGRHTRAVDELRRLLDRDAVLPESLDRRARAALEALDAQGRHRFEERAQAWIAQARAALDRRYAGIWGLDLGTTTCTVAIYDTETRQPVICPWKGSEQFASTLSLDKQGNELVGVAGEETLAAWLTGHIGAAKRKMGTRTTYRIQDRSYRPEEVAARLVRHARSIVEGFLAARIRERVGELARDELGEVVDDWLTWAEQNHDLRVSRPRALVTVPAYFTNNQKNATRDACQIAGVEVVRLIHEPTAACIAAARQRRLSGGVVVVDLGAGTLDLSFVDVGEGVYDVHQVFGDRDYGGKDFDAIITRALVARLRQQGVDVPERGRRRGRLEVAAEYLKVALSSQAHADYPLRAFADNDDVTVTLGRAELEELLGETLDRLRVTCAEFSTTSLAQTGSSPEHLVLVGGPMLSPLVRGVIEGAFDMGSTALQDPRTVVACGAALEAAVLDGKLSETLLLDVTPLPLGIRVEGEEEQHELSVLIHKNTTIPTSRQQTYTTTRDNQPAVNIEVFQGQLDPQSKIGQFRLGGLLPAPKGTPKIDVTFAIDASCVLQVTARDRGTGASRAITIHDSTLLSPTERDAMQRRFDQRQKQQEQRRHLHEVLTAQVAEATGTDVEALVQELRAALGGYRPSTARTDPETQQTLSEIFNGIDELQVELLLAEAPLGDLAAKAQEYLDRTGAQAENDELAEAQHLAERLRSHLDTARPLRARLARWVAVSRQLTTAEPDPLRRFQNCHAAGDHTGAVEALAEVPTPPNTAGDVARWLDSLAHVGDADTYRQVYGGHTESLHAAVLDPADPEAFLAHAAPALARVQVELAGGRWVEGSGFLTSDRLLVASQHLLVDRADGQRAAVSTARIKVHLGSGTSTVEQVFLPRATHSDIALLRLAEPAAATPFRLGYANLVRIGDRVCVIRPALAGETDTLLSSVVDQFESFPEQDLHLFKAGLRLPPQCSGSPLLNDLGEVVGILTIAEREETAGEPQVCFALTVDALHPLLTSAGFDRFAEPGGPTA